MNRVEELRALRRWWERGQRMASVWGRRRVGKTALVDHFAAGLPAVFHTGTGRPTVAELAQLGHQVQAALPHGPRDLFARPYADWDDALDDLSSRAEAGPLLLVLDEFPELVATSPELPGVLRAFLDRLNRAGGRLRILLCGSAVRHMEAMQEHRAPLYGRFDLALQVHPFRPHEAALMLPDLAAADRALVYGLLGGVPLYLSWWDQSASVADNLRTLACVPAAPLLTEGQLVLATEVERGDYPSAVLHAIASGRGRYGEIKDLVRAEPARTLERLTQLRLVQRLVPVTEEGRSRRVIYQITDNFLAFYLQVLSRYRSEIERGLGEGILPVLMASLDDFMGPRWEEAFRSHLRRLAVAGQFGEAVVAVGPWWTEDSRHEIDAVVLAGRARTPVAVGEAKWAQTIDGRRVRDALLSAAAHLPDYDPERVHTVLCARQGVRSAVPDTLVVTASDVFG